MTSDEWLFLLLVLIPGGLCIFSVLFYLLSKGRKVKIKVIYKRKNVYDILNSVTYSNGTSTHYTVDCTYEGSDKLHTFSCAESIFDQLEENKTYTIIKKMMDIIKVHENI